ncbi:MAG: class I SAM-dependent methyltransferase [Candidatus Omnitrophica bacterium]|nr:class I SAM-dependent methyltransferase [Candidatus Omnitrophota bacterium]
MRVWQRIKGHLHARWRSLRENNVFSQKQHWQEELAKYDWTSDKLFGYAWGDPESPKSHLGNYLEIKNRLVGQLTPGMVVVEIGSLGGKWTQYLLPAQEIVCVDINDLGFDYIRRKLPHPHIRFYLTKGDELRGIADGAVDLIFSMDSLVRVPKKFLANYFKEFYRVLKPSGKIFIHLPCLSQAESRRRVFVDLTLAEIEHLCRVNRFHGISIDQNVLTHGVMVEAVKA